MAAREPHRALANPVAPQPARSSGRLEQGPVFHEVNPVRAQKRQCPEPGGWGMKVQRIQRWPSLAPPGRALVLVEDLAGHLGQATAETAAGVGSGAHRAGPKAAMKEKNT